MTDAPTQAAPAPHKRRRRWPGRLITAGLILLGIAVIMYPIAATYYNNYKQSEFAQQYNQQVQTIDPGARSEQMAAAHRYNAALKPVQLKDPWGNGQPGITPAYQQYLAQLDVNDTMARLRIPTIKVDQPVYHGTSDETLGRGVGHLYGSSLPVGGPGTHSVLTAHSGMTNGTYFDRLGELKQGDVFYMDVLGETLAYQIDRITVVLPNNFDNLAREPGRDYATLITCTPYGVNSHRLLVRGHRIDYNPAHDPQPGLLGFDWTIQPWMITRLALAGIATLALLVMIGMWIRDDRLDRRRRRAEPSGTGPEQPTADGTRPRPERQQHDSTTSGTQPGTEDTDIGS